jgi:hypothetical protein
MPDGEDTPSPIPGGGELSPGDNSSGDHLLYLMEGEYRTGDHLLLPDGGEHSPGGHLFPFQMVENMVI